MALILAVSRRIVEGAQVVAAGKFEGWTPTWMCGRKLWGKRLGIVGMGRIGQALARRAKAFGMQVHYHNRKAVSPRIEEELGATYWDDLDQMLARMDVISLNCPATKETHHLLSAERLRAAAAARHPDQYGAGRADRRGGLGGCGGQAVAGGGRS